MNKTIKSIIDIIKSCDDLQLCTFGLNAYPETRTIMNGMNQCIESIDLHFLTMKSSPKFQQLENNNNCCLYYFNPTTRYAVRLFGKMENIEDQKEKINIGKINILTSVFPEPQTPILLCFTLYQTFINFILVKNYILVK